MINNFDQSSTGVSIEVSVFLDTFVAQMDFENNFTRLKNGKLLYLGGYAESKHQEAYDLPETGKEIFWDLFHDECGTCLTDAKNLLNGLSANGSMKEITGEDFVEFLLPNYLHDHEVEQFVTNKYEPLNFKEVAITGYNQGDYVVVTIHSQLVEAMEESGEGFDAIKNYLTNLLFDAPVYGRIEIITDDEEIEIMLDEYLIDVYNYDKDEIRDIVLKNGRVMNLADHQRRVVEDFMATCLPEYPEVG